MKEEINGVIAFIETLNKTMERSLYSYTENLHILTNTYTTAPSMKQVVRIQDISLSPIKISQTKK